MLSRTPKLTALRSTASLSDLAILLGFTPSGLSYTLYEVPLAQQYYKFTIPKKSGGVREISAPAPRLKLLQHRLGNILYDCRDELTKIYPRRPLAHGFRRSQSVIDNARKHTRRRFVLNIDLANFFPTINFGRVRGFFIKNRDFSPHEKVATVIAQIACFENSLPQGSPCSPVIADMLAHILDVRLVQLAKTNHVTYSRYADDLTISTNKRIFPSAFAFRDLAQRSEWLLGYDLTRTIKRAGFVLNPVKTRMQTRPGRQVVTGLTVNKKINVSQRYFRTARAMCNALFQDGAYHRGVRIAGTPDEDPQYEMIHSLNQLQGILSHIYHIKHRSRQIQLGTNTLLPVASVPGHKLYERFLFFKYFITNSHPLIITEGRTDNIYLKYAIRHLASKFPSLIETADPDVVPIVKFFNYNNKKAHRILELTGGAGNLMRFVNLYNDRLEHYRYRPLMHPVMILIDNDTALTAKFRAETKRRFDKDITLTSKEPFYHFGNNLYLIKTPELGSTGTSCIEDLFDETTRTIQLDGKSFSPAKSIDAATQYGKGPFAEKVVVPQAGQIVWDGFEPLLDRISAVIADYVPPASSIAVQAA
jgi:RNA-directed DNA polymerase